MRRFFTPVVALLLGAGVFLWLQFWLGPHLASLQARIPSTKEVQTLADLRAGKMVGQNGPALARVIDSTNDLLQVSYRLQEAVVRLAKLLCVALVLLGTFDLRTISRLHRQDRERASLTRA